MIIDTKIQKEIYRSSGENANKDIIELKKNGFISNNAFLNEIKGGGITTFPDIFPRNLSSRYISVLCYMPL